MAVARHRRAAVARRHREAAAPRPICQTRCAPRAPSVSHNKNRSSDDETRARFTYPSSETSTILILVFVGGGAASSSATSFGLLVEGLSPRGVLNFHRADFARARARGTDPSETSTIFGLVLAALFDSLRGQRALIRHELARSRARAALTQSRRSWPWASTDSTKPARPRGRTATGVWASRQNRARAWRGEPTVFSRRLLSGPELEGVQQVGSPCSHHARPHAGARRAMKQWSAAQM